MYKSFIFALLMAVATQMNAQGNKPAKTPKTPDDRAIAKTERLAKELGLNPSQKDKVKELLLAEERLKEADRQKIEEIKRNRRERHKALKGKLKSILTPEQFAKMENKQKELREKKKKEKKQPSFDDTPAPAPNDDPEDLELGGY